MARNEKDFDVPMGETFHPTLRWGAGVLTAKAITGISKAAPAVVTAVAHSLPNGWPCAVVGALGMLEINDPRYPPVNLHYGNVLTANTVELNDVSSANFSAYTSGGFLVYDTPHVLAGVDFTMLICSDPDFGTVLSTLTSNPAAGITVDDTLKTITPLLQTAGLTWDTAYFRLDATEGTVVTELLRGIIRIL